MNTPSTARFDCIHGDAGNVTDFLIGILLDITEKNDQPLVNRQSTDALLDPVTQFHPFGIGFGFFSDTLPDRGK